MKNIKFIKSFKYWFKYLCLGVMLGSMAGSPPLIQAQGNTVTTVLNVDSPHQTNFECTPLGVYSTMSAIYVVCNTTNAIKWFAYPASTGNTDFRNRSFRLMLTAFAIGKNLVIYYDPNSNSGVAYGCQLADCREIGSSGVEIK